MLDALKFVMPAVVKPGQVSHRAILSNLLIAGGRVTACNGRLALSSPVNITLDIAPAAAEFVRAVAACEEPILLNVNQAGKVVVRSGKGDFKTLVNCDKVAAYPQIVPEGATIPLTDKFLPALTYLEKFVSEDDSRVWACGILFEGESAYATNNVVLIQYWLQYSFPVRVNVPLAAVRELLRIGENPVSLQLSEGKLTFHYADGRYLITVLLSTPWPSVKQLFDADKRQGQAPVTAGFWEALERLTPFLDEMARVHFYQGFAMATTATPDDSGASVLCPGVPDAGIFNARALLNLRPVANTFAFSLYPKPVFFYGPVCRGIISGIVP